MSFAFVPTFVLTGDHENQPVRDEIGGDVSLHVEIPDRGTIQFLVRESDEFAGHEVDIVRAVSMWKLTHVSTRDEWKLENEDGRCWIPEPEVGRMVGSAIAGLSEGQVTGRAGAALAFDLFLHLEVELAAKSPWISEYFPKFFKHLLQKLEGVKTKKVKDVMES